MLQVMHENQAGVLQGIFPRNREEMGALTPHDMTALEAFYGRNPGGGIRARQRDFANFIGTLPPSSPSARFVL